MIASKYIKTFQIFCKQLSGYKINWVLTGSLGMAIQGMDVEVHDIDIQTDQRGAYEIEGLFSEHVVTAIYYKISERIRSHFGILEIEGVRVEIMGDVQKLLDTQNWEEPINIEQYRRWISFEGMQVPVLSLEYEYHAYRGMGRFEKAEEIKSWLDKNR
jgi:hypothetical protein